LLFIFSYTKVANYIHYSAPCSFTLIGHPWEHLLLVCRKPLLSSSLQYCCMGSVIKLLL
jgi:hypothetical protein